MREEYFHAAENFFPSQFTIPPRPSSSCNLQISIVEIVHDHANASVRTIESIIIGNSITAREDLLILGHRASACIDASRTQIRSESSAASLTTLKCLAAKLPVCTLELQARADQTPFNATLR